MLFSHLLPRRPALSWLALSWALTLAWASAGAAPSQPAPQAPRSGASSAPAAVPAAPLQLRFSDFFQRPIGPRGLELSPTLLAAQGQEVQIQGFMVAQEQPRAGRFWLSPVPLRLSEHADGEADDLPPGVLTVVLDAQHAQRVVSHQPGLLQLRGRLQVGREQGPDGRVSWVRLYMAPEALGAQASEPPTPHSH
jgi:hypothetical protein